MNNGTEIARTALKQAQSRWSTYFRLLGGIVLAVAIDYFNGLQFVLGQAEIKALGLTLTRSTFSVIYMLVFAALVLGHVGAARMARTLCEELTGPGEVWAVARSGEVRLWTPSPLDANPLKRTVFWSMAAFGLVVLAVVTSAHLLMWNVGPDDKVSDGRYFRVGLYCAATLIGSLWLAVTRIYPDWERVRAILRPSTGRAG